MFGFPSAARGSDGGQMQKKMSVIKKTQKKNCVRSTLFWKLQEARKKKNNFFCHHTQVKKSELGVLWSLSPPSPLSPARPLMKEDPKGGHQRRRRKETCKSSA